LKLSKKNKKLIFFSSILLIFAIGFSTYAIFPLSPFEINSGNLYITSGDVIKNFKFESYDDNLITTGTVDGLGNRLKFETGALWTTDPDDVIITYKEQVGDKVYINYDIVYTTDMNIYTNARLNDVVGTGKTADPVVETLTAGIYNHYGCFGGAPFISWKGYLYFNHLDVGDIRSYNAENNLFSGNVVMNFDIDDSPLPDTLTDSNGNVANKSFDYIGVKAVYVDNTITGSLSDYVPTIVGLTPSEYDISKKTVSGGSASGDIAGDFEAKFNPDPILGDTFVSNTVDYGIQPQSDGSSLFPTLKGGQAIYDPRTSQKSMPNCEYTYNIGSLSPLIKEYSNTLTYYYQDLATQDYLASVIPWVGGIQVTKDINTKETVTRVTGLHVTNRYIHTTMSVKFSVWSSYEIVPVEDTNLPDLQYPQEYYDDLVYSSVVDGFGGGTIYKEASATELFNTQFITGFVITIVIIAVAGLTIYVVAKKFMKTPFRRSKK